jgi:hypothetical protein
MAPERGQRPRLQKRLEIATMPKGNNSRMLEPSSTPCSTVLISAQHGACLKESGVWGLPCSAAAATTEPPHKEAYSLHRLGKAKVPEGNNSQMLEPSSTPCSTVLISAQHGT